MSQFIVIGTSPASDTSVVVGPFRSYANAQAADLDVVALGYVTEICECLTVAQLDVSAPWDGYGNVAP